MENINLSTQITLIITLVVGAFFITLGYVNLKKVSDNKSHIVGDRNESIFSLTTSLSASALGAWILFGPASAATWGGIGAVIGYALGTAFPLFILIYLGQKFRKLYPKAKTLIEVIRLRFGQKLFKLIYKDKQKTARCWDPLLTIYFLLIDYFLYTKKQMVSI